jgi:hypothetical protein
VRRISREVELIFKKEGEIWPPLWFVETPIEGMIIFGTPIHEREYKSELAKFMTSHFQEVNARRYVSVAQCWIHHEDREKTEALQILAYDGNQRLASHCDIVRPMGCEPYLTKFIDLDLPEFPEGSMYNVQLPARIEH